ncbi:MAG: extracellular solute-binding protein, partial [Chloroflexota bacterium]
QDSAPPVTGGRQVTLEIWNPDWGPISTDGLQLMSREFEAKHPTITVTWTVLSGNRVEKLIAASAAGTPPDTHYINSGFSTSFAHKGLLHPLDAYFKATKLTRKDFVAAVYDQNVYKGTLYGVPGGSDWIALFYNKEVFAQAGLDPERPPRTFKEMAEVSATINQKDSSGEFTRIGNIPGTPYGFSPRSAVYMYGGTLYDEANARFTLDHPKNVEAIEMLAAYARQIDYAKAQAFLQGKPNYRKAENVWYTNSAAFLHTGFWLYEEVDKYRPDLDYGAAWPVPGLTGTKAEMKNFVIGGWGHANPSGSRNHDEAWLFLRHFFIDNAAQMGYLSLNGPSVIGQLDLFKKELIQRTLKPDNRMAKHMDFLLEVARNGTHPSAPPTILGTRPGDEFEKAVTAALLGQAPVREALTAANRTLQGELDQALRGG